MTVRPHGEIDGAEPRLGDDGADVGEGKPLQMFGEDGDHRLVDAAVAQEGQRTPAPQRCRGQSQRGSGDELAATRMRVSRRLGPSHGVILCSSINLRAK